MRKGLFPIVMVLMLIITTITPVTDVKAEDGSYLIRQKLEQIMQNEYKENTNWDPDNKGFPETGAKGWTCFGFAKKIQYELFGVIPSWSYDGTPLGNLVKVAQLNLGQYNEANMRTFISQAKPGDIIQADVSDSTGNDKQHTMIFCWQNSNDTFTVYDANVNFDNLVHIREITYARWSNNDWRHLTLLRSTNYPDNIIYPSKPALDFDRSNNPIYKIAKNQVTAPVRFTWNKTDNTACYDLKLYDWNSKLVKEVTAITNQNTWELQLPKGNYSAVIFSRNTMAQTESNWVVFQVVEEPQIRTDKTLYINGESITVSWDAMSYAEAYDLYVYDWGSPANLIYSCTGISNRTSWTVTLPTGNYSVVLFPKNQYGSVESNWVPFQVVDPQSYKVTVTFNSQGGSTVQSVASVYNSTIAEPAAPSKSGYNFDGWYKEVECKNLWDFSAEKVTVDITLYAKWIDICDLDLDGTVSILDLAEAAKNYNATSTDSEWNENVDFNKDGIVDIFDLVVCSKKIGLYRK